MSIDHQQPDHFKREREQELESSTITSNKRRKLNGSKDGKKEEVKDNGGDDDKDNKDASDEFDTKLYRPYIKSALEALDDVSTCPEVPSFFSFPYL